MTDAPPESGIGPGRLMLVVSDPQWHDAIEASIRVHATDVRPLRPGALVLYADAECAEVRDWFAGALPADARAFVVEFERWSAAGAAINPAWLLRRGH